jgi:hypothetical protein
MQKKTEKEVSFSERKMLIKEITSRKKFKPYNPVAKAKKQRD